MYPLPSLHVGRALFSPAAGGSQRKLLPFAAGGSQRKLLPFAAGGSQRKLLPFAAGGSQSFLCPTSQSPGVRGVVTRMIGGQTARGAIRRLHGRHQQLTGGRGGRGADAGRP